MAHLIYLRNDLRILDHDIFHALQKEEIIPLYVFDGRKYEKDALDQERTGLFRQKFLIQCLEALKEELISRGGNLMVAKGNPAEVIRHIQQTTPIEAVHFYRHDAWEEQVQEREIEDLGIPIHTYSGDYLYHPEDFPFPIEKIPFVFTNFRKKLEKYAEVRAFHPTPSKFMVPTSITDWGEIPSIPDFEQDLRSSFPFPGGTRAALDRLEHYFWGTDALSQYKETRNGMVGTAYSSKFSPWLAQGAISARFIYHQVKKYEKLRVSNSSTYWLIFELMWRDFFRFSAAAEGKTFFRVEENFKPRVTKEFQAWKNGTTGIDFVDAAMRELAATGYTSNRARQNVASFLVHHLKQPWYAGALWFESVLIDYDVYSNYGNWTYVAGVGHDPRSRVFNIERQQSMYDANGLFTRTWVK